MKMRDRYKLNRSLKVGDKCTCPSCQSEFIKGSYQQMFCKTKPKTQCKDKYWNTVTPEKRCNTTRISPASASWMERKREYKENNPDWWYEEHPFSSEGLGQW